MPNSWAMVDSSFPTFSGNEKPREQISALVSYMHILVEELKFQLENLDTKNWNTAALKTFQTDTTADVSEQLSTVAANLMQLTNEVSAMNIRLSAVENLTGRVNQAETDIAYLEKAQEETDGRLDDIEGQLTDAQGDIDSLRQDLDAVREIVKPDDSGGATLGGEGKVMHLVGQIYINGKLME